jgi:hypothetical protein
LIQVFLNGDLDAKNLRLQSVLQKPMPAVQLINKKQIYEVARIYE